MKIIIIIISIRLLTQVNSRKCGTVPGHRGEARRNSNNGKEGALQLNESPGLVSRPTGRTLR